MAEGTGFTGMPTYPAYGVNPPTTAFPEATTTSEPVASSSAPRWYAADYHHPLPATGAYCNGFFLTGTQSLLFDRFSWIIFWILDGMFCDRRRQDRSARQIPRQIVADDRRKIKREVNNRCLLSVQIIFRHA